MKFQDIKKLAVDLQEQWDEYRFENDWGSGSDYIYPDLEIEKEYYEEQCLDLGLTDKEIDLVLEQIGY